MVINATAYNFVDRAEEERPRAFALNAEAVGSLAAACHSLGAVFVHFSTDYVFDGHKRTPYVETDAPAPWAPTASRSSPGAAGARALRANGHLPRVRALRDRGQLGQGELRRDDAAAGARGKPLRVVADQVLGPSSRSTSRAGVGRAPEGDPFPLSPDERRPDELGTTLPVARSSSRSHGRHHAGDRRGVRRQSPAAGVLRAGARAPRRARRGRPPSLGRGARRVHRRAVDVPVASVAAPVTLSRFSPARSADPAPDGNRRRSPSGDWDGVRPGSAALGAPWLR